MSLNGVRRENR